MIDKYFGCNAGTEALRAKVAKAICENCVVLFDCRDQALTMVNLPTKGVIGGVTASEVWRARGWRNYEAGLNDRTPEVSRPDWLPRSDAAETVEEWRVTIDPDEPEIER